VRPPRLALVLALASWLAAPAAAVLIDSPDDEANTRAPRDDPGFANVGRQGLRSSVYLGDGWVLTAHHVPVEGVTTILAGVEYAPVPESRVRLANRDGSPSDLQLFRIAGDPRLPRLRIRPLPPRVGDAVVMIGYGRERGAERRDLFAPADVRDGWEWLPDSHRMRWGTNLVSGSSLDVLVQGSRVRHFTLSFDRGLPTPHEAYATPGDSGGAVFIRRAGVWELAGIMFAADVPDPPLDQVAVLSTPPRFATRTYCADLSYYRDGIRAILGRDRREDSGARRDPPI
jgi:hypothetical protein